MHISTDVPKVSFVFDQVSAEASLEDVTKTVMAEIPPTGIASQQKLHATRQVGLRRTKEKMEMIRHQNCCEHLPCVLLDGFADSCEKGVSIQIIDDNVLSAIPATGHMINRSRKLNSKFSRHGSCPASRETRVLPSTNAKIAIM